MRFNLIHNPISILAIVLLLHGCLALQPTDQIVLEFDGPVQYSFHQDGQGSPTTRHVSTGAEFAVHNKVSSDPLASIEENHKRTLLFMEYDNQGNLQFIPGYNQAFTVNFIKSINQAMPTPDAEAEWESQNDTYKNDAQLLLKVSGDQAIPVSPEHPLVFAGNFTGMKVIDSSGTIKQQGAKSDLDTVINSSNGNQIATNPDLSPVTFVVKNMNPASSSGGDSQIQSGPGTGGTTTGTDQPTSGCGIAKSSTSSTSWAWLLLGLLSLGLGLSLRLRFQKN